MDQAEADKLEKERGSEIHAVMSFVIALGVVLLGIGGAVTLVVTGVKATPDDAKKSPPEVEVRPLALGEHQVRIVSQGLVDSRREVRLGAVVGGRVTEISANLVDGGMVRAGEGLVEIDKQDFVAAEARARSILADAKLALELEQARGKQAERDWEKLGKGKASDLVLRIPQIDSATKKVDSALADVERAARDVKRATIVAPFDGRVRSVAVEVGAVLAPGAMVAELYSDTDLEVRMPFALADFGYIQAGDVPEFELTAIFGGKRRHWPATMARVEGEVDRETLSGYAIARVLPSKEDGSYPPVGLFVQALIQGPVISDVVEIPRKSLRGKDEIWVVEGDRLKKVLVEIIRTTRESLVVRAAEGDGFAAGNQLVLTRLNAPLVGELVRVSGLEAPADAELEPEVDE